MKISKSSPDLWTKLPEYTLIHTLTSVTCTRQELVFKILLQCYSTSYFLSSLNMTTSLVSPITMFTNLWNVTQSRHFHLLRLQLHCTVPNSGNSKACLIDRSKKREENTSWPHFPCYSASTHESHRCLPKDSWNFGGFFWPEYLGSPLEVVQLFWSTKIFWLFHFWQTGSSLPHFSSLM